MTASQRKVRPSEAPQAATGGRVLRLGWTRGLSVKDSYRLGNCTFMGSYHLGKYPWEVAAWENCLWETSIVLLTLAAYKSVRYLNRIYIYLFCCWLDIDIEQVSGWEPELYILFLVRYIY